MRKTVAIFAASLCICSAGVSPAAAQDNGSIHSILIPTDPATMTMGTVSSYGNPVFAAENNITAAALMGKKVAAGVSYAMWNADGNMRHVPALGVAFRIKKWGIALNAGGYANNTPYDIYDETGTPVGSFLPYDAKVSLGAAYAFDFGLAVGVTVRGIRSAIHPDYSATVGAGDIYAAYNAGRVSATVGVCNIGTPVRYSPEAKASHLPMIAKAGVNVRPVKGLQVAVEGDCMLNNTSWMINAGAQYTIMKIATVRAGFHYNVGGKSAIPSYASVGAGFRFFGFELSGTYIFASPVLRNTFSAALTCSF